MLFDRRNDQISVTRLRVRSSESDVLAIQLRIANLFNTANLQPSGAPPSSVLIIRRFADPLPGRFVPKPTARIDPVWERAVQSKLAEFYAHAARPSQGSVPANAEAVLFDDEAEMLACLLVDMSRQEARRQWWWRTLLRELPDAGVAGVTLLLCRRAARVPAVLQQLIKHGQAIRVITVLEPSQALAVLAAMSRSYDMSPPLQWEAAVTADLPAAMPGLSAEAGKTSSSSPDWGLPPTGATPWREWLPDSLSLNELAREQLCLLGLGLGLYQAPALVRSPGFLHSLRDWWLATAAPVAQFRPPPPSADPSSGRSTPADATQPAAQPQQPAVTSVENITPVMPAAPFGRAIEQDPAQAPAATHGSAAQQPPQTDSSRDRPVTPPEPSAPAQGRSQLDEPGVSIHPTAGEIQPPAVSSPAVPLESSGRQPSAGEELSTLSIKRPDIVTVSPDNLLPLPEPVIQPPSPAALRTDPAVIQATHRNQTANESAVTRRRLADGVPTRLGGVWYLINLMAYLDLPDCFEDEGHLASRLGAWGTLEALARALLANGDSALLEDPLWLALAELSGRQPGEALGTGLPEDADFRLPFAWLAHSDPGDPSTYAWASDGQQLRLWSQEKSYLLVEVARGPLEPAAQAAMELRRYRGDAPLQRDRQQAVGVRTSPQPTAYRKDAPPPLDRQRFDDAPLAHLEGPLMAGLSPSLRRWLERVIPYLRWRLRRALPGGGADDPGEWLCQPGQLYVTSTHVDLVMSLDVVSVPIRLAGLDRDPGWLPEFGRVIKFYFE
jgi:hypothetical protein